MPVTKSTRDASTALKLLSADCWFKSYSIESPRIPYRISKTSTAFKPFTEPSSIEQTGAEAASSGAESDHPRLDNPSWPIRAMKVLARWFLLTLLLMIGSVIGAGVSLQLTKSPQFDVSEDEVAVAGGGAIISFALSPLISLITLVAVAVVGEGKSKARKRVAAVIFTFAQYGVHLQSAGVGLAIGLGVATLGLSGIPGYIAGLVAWGILVSAESYLLKRLTRGKVEMELEPEISVRS